MTVYVKQAIQKIDRMVDELLDMRLSLMDELRMNLRDFSDIEEPRPMPTPRPFQNVPDDVLSEALGNVNTLRKKRRKKPGRHVPKDPDQQRVEIELTNEARERSLENGKNAGVFK